MGDLSAEPSMEDILSSIKRIIAEEGEQPARRARPARAVPAAPPRVDAYADDETDEVLELKEPIAPRAEPVARSEPAPLPRVAREPAPEPRAAPDPLTDPRPPREASGRVDPIVGHEAAAASRGSLEALSRLLVKPEPGNDGTLEGLVRELLRPLLREWLDANLPALVETLVGREIERIVGQAR